MKTRTFGKKASHFPNLAVPFWIIERAREIVESASFQQRGEIGARRKKTRRD